MKTLLSILFFIIIDIIVCFASENYILQLKFDIVEFRKEPRKQFVLEKLDNLLRRNSEQEGRYIIGGIFNLQEFLQNKFVLKQKDNELSIAAGYSKITDNRFKINYSANLSYPAQPNSLIFVNEIVMDYNEIKIIDKNKLPGRIDDTKPYWIILRINKVEQEYVDETSGNIGAVLNIKDGYPYVTEVIPYTPAEKLGLKIDDRIIEIDDIDMFGKNLQESLKKISGKPGTNVKLKILSAIDKSYKEVILERKIISSKF